MRPPHNRRFIPIVGVVLLVLLVPVFSPHAAATTSSHGTTGIIIPLYSYPGSDWSNLIWAKQANPNVPMIAAINPDGGPGYYQDIAFLSGIARLQSAGIGVIGYISTNYGAVSISSVEAQISAYKAWYGVNGVYLDQMSNIPGLESYYSTLTAYAESLGMKIVVGNPGTTVPASYFGTVTTIVMYENNGAPSASTMSGLEGAANKAGFAMVAYGVPSFTTGYLDSVASYVGYVYLTNGFWPNPYAPESSYLDSLASALAAYDGTSGPGSITVNTIDSHGSSISGLYTSLWENGAVVGSCFSPCTYAVQGGHSYQVEVYDYGPYAFSEWGNGLQNRFFSVTEPATATQLGLWAVYNVG